MSVNFFKSSLALSLALLAMASGSDAKANDFYPQVQGQPMGLQMPGPQMQMSAPPMQQSYQPAPQSVGYGPGPSMQQQDPRLTAQYGRPQYGPQSFPGMSPMPQQMSAPYCPQPSPGPQVPPEKIQIADENCAVDLVITDISFYVPATKLAGPSYTVKVRNKGTHYAQRFHIGLFASLDGVVNEQTPKAFLEVRDLAPGSDGDYTISLPLNADSNFDPRFGQFRPFTHIAAVVDVFRIQHEGDESNNTAMVAREVVDNAQQ